MLEFFNGVVSRLCEIVELRIEGGFDEKPLVMVELPRETEPDGKPCDLLELLVEVLFVELLTELGLLTDPCEGVLGPRAEAVEDGKVLHDPPVATSSS